MRLFQSMAGRMAMTGLLVFVPAAVGADQLPDGAGKATLQRVCSACHSAEIVIGKHETKERWEEIVSSMAEKGATGTDEEFNQIIEYLAANFGKPKTPASTGFDTAKAGQQR